MNKSRNNILSSKNFLEADDISTITSCGRTKSYQMINELNSELKKKGIKILSGKVNARYFYEKYGLNELLDEHNAYVNGGI